MTASDQLQVGARAPPGEFDPSHDRSHSSLSDPAAASASAGPGSAPVNYHNDHGVEHHAHHDDQLLAGLEEVPGSHGVHDGLGGLDVEDLLMGGDLEGRLSLPGDEGGGLPLLYSDEDLDYQHEDEEDLPFDTTNGAGAQHHYHHDAAVGTEGARRSRSNSR